MGLGRHGRADRKHQTQSYAQKLLHFFSRQARARIKTVDARFACSLGRQYTPAVRRLRTRPALAEVLVLTQFLSSRPDRAFQLRRAACRHELAPPATLRRRGSQARRLAQTATRTFRRDQHETAFPEFLADGTWRRAGPIYANDPTQTYGARSHGRYQRRRTAYCHQPFCA